MHRPHPGGPVPPNPFKRFKEHRQWSWGVCAPPVPTSPEQVKADGGRTVGSSGREVTSQGTCPTGSRQAGDSRKYVLENRSVTGPQTQKYQPGKKQGRGFAEGVRLRTRALKDRKIRSSSRHSAGACPSQPRPKGERCSLKK